MMMRRAVVGLRVACNARGMSNNKSSEKEARKHQDHRQKVQTVASFSAIPVGSSAVGLGSLVTVAARVAFQAKERGDVEHVEVSPTATLTEGNLTETLKVIEDVARKSLTHNKRIVMQVTLDIYPDQENRLSKKHALVQQVLNEVRHKQ